MAGGGDDQPAAGSAAHVRDRVIFQQPHRFPKHRAAHLVAFQQRCLGPEDRPDLPAAGGDIVANGGRQHLGQLAAGRARISCWARRGSRASPVADSRIVAALVLLQPAGYRLNVSFA